MTLSMEPGGANPSKILTKSSLSRRELPPATSALLEGGTLPKCTENKLSFKRNSAKFRLSIDLRRYVLRTEARNLSKVSQMHPENMQEHFLRFATLCSAHRSPELVKSIPNASRKYARALFEIRDVMFCAQKPRTCQKCPKCIQKKCKCIFV